MKRLLPTLYAALFSILFFSTGAVAAIQCYECHGTSGPADYRPLDATHRNISSGGFPGNHRNHMGAGATPANCNSCHGKGVDVSTYPNSHRDGNIDMVANINNSPKAGGATYSRGLSFSQTPNPITGTCSNVNCHFESSTPVWGSAAFTTPNDCDQCHGTPPSGGATGAAGSHAKHETYYSGITHCQKCHSNNTTFAHATSAGKRTLNVSFAAAPNNGSGAYSGALDDYLPSQNPSGTAGFGNCTATYCHGTTMSVAGDKNGGTNITPTWGTASTGQCGTCHGVDATNPPHRGSHQSHAGNGEWFFGYPPDPVQDINKKIIGRNMACSVCHKGYESKHVDGNADWSFDSNTKPWLSGARYKGLSSGSATPVPSAYGQCSNLYCHSIVQTATGGPLTGVAGEYKTPTWGNVNDGRCGSCHAVDEMVHARNAGGLPNGTPEIASGSHSRHLVAIGLSAGLGGTPGGPSRCAVCHNYSGSDSLNGCATTCHNGQSIHVDRKVDIKFPPTLYGASAAYTGTPAPGDGFGNCTATYCHSDGKATPSTYAIPTWGNPASGACGTCHGVAAATPPASTPHTKHLGSANPYRIACDACHNGKVQATANSTIQPGYANLTSHVNKVRDVKFNSGSPFGTYSSASQSCRNLYCHSTGNLSVTAGALPAVYNGKVYTRQTWSGTLACNGCHGRSSSNGMPDYTNGGAATATANSHPKHVASSAIGCVQCHEKTTKSGTTIRDSIPSKHVDATTHDVFFNLTSLNASGSYNNTRQRCYSIYCHSDGTKASGFAAYSSAPWGATLNCKGCHKENFDGSSNISSGSHSAHIYSWGGYGAKLACVKCHAATTTADMSISNSGRHVDGLVTIAYNNSSSAISGRYDGTLATPASPMSKTPGSASATCSTVYCHSTGQGTGGTWPPTYTTPTWGNPASGACGTCHAIQNTHGNGSGFYIGTATPLTTGSHSKHLSFMMGFTGAEKCAACHAYTLTGFSPAACNSSQCHTGNLVQTSHPNYAVNVGIPNYYGASASYSGTTKPGDGYGSCSSNYCHSDGKATPTTYATPTWGNTASGACGTCHGVSAAAPPASVPHLKHMGAANQYRYACAECHSGKVQVTADSTVVPAFTNLTSHVDKTRNVKFDASNAFGTYSSATQSCRNLYCHSTGNTSVAAGNLPAVYGGKVYNRITWSGSTTCNSCHGRSTSNGMPDYTNAGAAGSNTSNSHSKHVSSYAIACVECHEKTTKTGTTIRSAVPSKHVDGTNHDVYFNLSGNSAAGSYDNALKKCSNTYCHSNGTSLSSASVPANTTASWGTAGPLACNACHGNPPAYTSGSPKTNNHAKHNYTCNICHSTVTSNGTAITTAANHANKTYNVVQGGTATFTYAFNAGGGTCSTISCHGNNNATWGTTLTCQACHLSTADVDNYVYNNGTIATVKNVGEWDTTGHGKASGTYASGSNAAAFTVTNACLYCHETTVNHGDGTNVFRLKNFADATWGKNGVCMSCHVTASVGVTVDTVLKNGAKKVSAYHNGTDHTGLKNGGQFCWDCHDPHGDTNRYMIQTAVAKTSDATTGVPTATVAVTFTASATGTDYAGANATKLCNACHTTASHYAGASGDGHNSGVRCTGCHSHNNSDNKAYAFQAGESTGGSACGACHSDLYNSDQTKYSMHSNVAGISYKHYLDNDAASYSTTLPNGPATNLTSRKCTMCHVDHDIFRVTASATAGRAFNIRPNAGVTPTAGSNTDLISCTSCHYQVSTKAIVAPFSEDDSMPIPFPGLTFANATSMIKSSTHGYPVASQEFADATRGNTTFYANCTKCHNDTIGKNNGAKSSYNAQDGTQPTRSKFGNHMTTNNNFFSVFNNDSLGHFYQGTATSATNTTNATITVTGAGWTTNQWMGYYVVTTGGTGQNQRKMITSNTATVLTLSGTFTTALDATTKFDIVQASISTDNVCFACHSRRNQGKGARAGFDWYSSMPIRSELEGMDDTFIILADTGTVSSFVSGSSGTAPPTMTDSTKSWTTNQLQNYTVRFTNGVVRKITSNTATTLSLTYNKKVVFSVSNGMAYEIFKPAYHPLDEYGRHSSIERVAPVKRSYNQGDMGEITAYISTTQFKDDTRAWVASQWNGSTISFPKQGATSTISSVTLDANSVPTVTFSPAVSGLAVGTPYFIGTRHVSCADCHNSHSAQPYPFGYVTTAASAGGTTLQANDAKNPAGITKWVNNQWTGYLLRVRSASTNLEQIRYITAYNASTGTFTVGLPWNTAIAAYDHFDVITSDRWTTSGHDAGRAGSGTAGVWGIQVGGFTTPAAGSFQNMTTATYTKVENVYDRTGTLGGNATAGQRDLCVRCHSYYAYGKKPSTTTTPGPQDAATGSSGPTPSTDVAQELNPNNASHHAVYARGNNQPLKANYAQAGITSYMNANWPIYTNAGNVSVANGTATLTTSGLPRTALPGWYIYIGSKTRTAVTGAAGTASNGYLEITSISSPTSFTVRAANGSGGWVTNLNISSNANWYVTAGLANAFIPPYGPWSVLLCTDCHGSTKTDPLGPHASANDFLLKSLDTSIQFEWYNGTSVTTVQPNNKTATQLDSYLGRQIFCWNCHRADVYANTFMHGAPANDVQSRAPHSSFTCGDNKGLSTTPSTFLPPGWQIWCKHCHGGDMVGGTHGTNSSFAAGSPQTGVRKRFLNGATWVGYGKVVTGSSAGTCYTQAAASAVSSCAQHSGGGKTPTTATYDYW